MNKLKYRLLLHLKFTYAFVTIANIARLIFEKEKKIVYNCNECKFNAYYICNSHEQHTHTHILPTENEMKRTEIIIRPLKKKKSKKPANGNDLT